MAERTLPDLYDSTLDKYELKDMLDKERMEEYDNAVSNYARGMIDAINRIRSKKSSKKDCK